MIQRILRDVETLKDFNGHMWLNTIPSNDDYPHAPWWNYVSSQELNYNPTACFIGFILKKDRKLVTEFLLDKHIDVIVSSPYKRAIDTIADFAETSNLKIEIIEDFRERRVDSEWIADFQTFCKKQWEDFNYKLSDGETLNEVQSRNINALNNVLEHYKGKTIVIGSHGTSLSTIINYYDKTFGYSEFEKIRNVMPWVVKFTFEDMDCIGIQKYNLFEI